MSPCTPKFTCAACVGSSGGPLDEPPEEPPDEVPPEPPEAPPAVEPPEDEPPDEEDAAFCASTCCCMTARLADVGSIAIWARMSPPMRLSTPRASCASDTICRPACM